MREIVVRDGDDRFLSCGHTERVTPGAGARGSGKRMRCSRCPEEQIRMHPKDEARAERMGW